MRTIIFIIQKEFRQILRDKSMIVIMLGMPIIQLLVLPWAIDLDVRHVRISLVDSDKTSYSRELCSKIAATKIFELYDTHNTFNEAIADIESEKASIVLEIPRGFERYLIKEGKSSLLVCADAIDGVKAGLGTAYLNVIISEFNKDITFNLYGIKPEMSIKTTFSTLYNPNGSYHNFMVPAILVLLLTVVGMSLAAMNIVKEKEIGTIEQINVTPIKKWQFILGKLLPFIIISLIALTIGLLIMRFLYQIHIEGSIGLLYFVSVLFLICVLGLGLLISTFASNQQQGMFINFFFIMIFILMSGLFTLIESMPTWGRIVAEAIPVTHFMRAMRSIILKGSGFYEIKQPIIYLTLMLIVVNALAIINYRKRS